MGETESRTPDSWGVPLSKLFEHRLVRLLNEADAVTLTCEESATILYKEMRSFMALKSALVAGDPPEALRPVNEALLRFTNRLFKTAHQALLNHGKKDESPAAHGKRDKGQHHPAAPTREFLLEWQLVRMKSARQKLVMELAYVSEKNEGLYQSLALPEPMEAEVESARVRISNVWKQLPDFPWTPSRHRSTGARLAG